MAHKHSYILQEEIINTPEGIERRSRIICKLCNEILREPTKAVRTNALQFPEKDSYNETAFDPNIEFRLLR